MATIEDFKKIEIRAGLITAAERIPESEKLIKLLVSFGAFGVRQILAGIAPHFPEAGMLIGRKCAFAYNLDSRTLMGIVSEGMILATGEAGAFSLLSIDQSVPEGSIIR
ncbi:MAG: hypothetical protein A2664_01420 [Candidatus Taylorbacteria bacterium RIFCSPHIGHO2_01_FULL_46_22b]|uniref:tRNA-binding domain-containing protein n=1 Tax=Candidatus Taylorbacteria bacterium RIFCSPHIGHO2_01_FULL_46_22b TaxID=1802301 RepID=A0A1G2M4G4_9BACT|nr:MAG: hypothetical protein A2664_01420 [Candidatus Taylorbacteria bacterium RIFCSPHIGHO2_01_FULL_46_22b]